MLTNAAVKAAGARDRAYKLHDSGGLFLHVATTGTRTWRQKYRWRGREKLLVHGRFPEMNLAVARMRVLEAKAQLDRGVDPAARVDLKVNSFEQLARAWYRHNVASWSAAHAADAIGSLERDVFPELGRLAPDAIGAPVLLAALRSVENRGCVASAQRIRQRLSEIFEFGIAEGLCSSNAARSLGAAMKDVPPATPHPALTTIEDCRALLQACEEVSARPAMRLASRFLALTAVRLDSVRGMRWGELEDLHGDQPLWRVPPARLKLKRAKKGEQRFAHLVPLSTAAVAVLREIMQFMQFMHSHDANLHDVLVFPGRVSGQPIGEGSIGELYRRTPFAGRHVPHGWRSSFSTILNEQLGETSRSAIDAALGHAKSDKVEAAYNRAQLLERRREVLEHWGELLAG